LRRKGGGKGDCQRTVFSPSGKPSRQKEKVHGRGPRKRKSAGRKRERRTAFGIPLMRSSLKEKASKVDS